MVSESRRVRDDLDADACKAFVVARKSSLGSCSRHGSSALGFTHVVAAGATFASKKASTKGGKYMMGNEDLSQEFQHI